MTRTALLEDADDGNTPDLTVKANVQTELLNREVELERPDDGIGKPDLICKDAISTKLDLMIFPGNVGFKTCLIERGLEKHGLVVDVNEYKNQIGKIQTK